MGNGPIFIGGLSFSGKTQLRLMLCAHPNIVITRRTYMWRKVYNQYGDLGDPENFERCLGAMLAQKHIQALEPEAERIRHEFRQGAPTYARLFGLFHQQHAERVGKARWGDQLGFIEQYADAIFGAFPEARIIQMVRDPRERIGESLVGRTALGRLGWELAQWRLSAELAQRNKRQYPGRYLVVHCEELFADTEKVLRSACAFLDETFFPNMMMGIELQIVPVALSEPEQHFIQTQAGREMSSLGYRPGLARSSLKSLLVNYPANMAGMWLWDIFGQKEQL